MNENIKEIVNIIGNAELSNKCHSDCFINTDFDDECSLCRQATALHKAGYRKQSETVKEFAEKLTKAFYELEQDNYKAGRKESAFGVMCAGHLVYEIATEFGKEEK